MGNNLGYSKKLLRLVILNDNRTGAIDDKVVMILKSSVSIVNSCQFHALGKQTICRIDAKEYLLKKFFPFG